MLGNERLGCTENWECDISIYIYISMIRLWPDVSDICNKKPWIPGEQDVIPRQYLSYVEIHCFRHIVGIYYMDGSFNIWLH